MTRIPANVDWVGELIPDLDSRIGQFVVDTDEMDDELIEVFCSEIRRLADELHDGLATGNADTVRLAAHSIKGMGGTMGLPQISVLGQEIELMSKAYRLDRCAELVRALDGWLASFE